MASKQNKKRTDCIVKVPSMLSNDDLTKAICLIYKSFSEEGASINPFTLKAIEHRMKKYGISEKDYKRIMGDLEKKNNNPRKKKKIVIDTKELRVKIREVVDTLQLEYVQEVANTKRRLQKLGGEISRWAEKQESR